MSFRSKQTNLTYVIESRTDISRRNKQLDAVKMDDDDERAELLSHESHTTFRTCYIESKQLIDEEKRVSFLKLSKKSIQASSSNIEMSAEQTNDIFRVTRSCENGQRDFDNAIDTTSHQRDASVPRSVPQGHPSLSETGRKQDGEKGSFVRDAYSSSKMPV